MTALEPGRVSRATPVVFFDAESRPSLPNSCLDVHTRPDLLTFVDGNDFKIVNTSGRKRGGGASALASDVGPSDVKKTVSHYMYGNLGGMGKLCVPTEYTEAMARCVTQDYRNGVFWALTENRPGASMKFYMDFDWSFASETQFVEAEDSWPIAVKHIVAEMMRFWPGVPLQTFSGIVLASGVHGSGDAGTSAAAPGASSKKSKFHAGIHIIFPNLCVSVEHALYMAAAIIARLDAANLARGSAASWDQVIDLGVYHELRGLRWAWQLKHKACGNCSKMSLTTTKCSVCNGMKNIVDRSASMYTPRARIRGYDLVDVALLSSVITPTPELLVEASIRGCGPEVPCTVGWTLYKEHPPLPVLVKGKGKGTDAVISAFLDTSTAAHTKSRASGSDPELPRSDIRFQVLTACIRKCCSKYNEVNLHKITIKAGAGNRLTYRVLVTGFGSLFCANKGDYHNGSTVWFQVSEGKGIVQRCHCAKFYNGISCKTFCKAMPLPPEALPSLFPTSSSGSATAAATAAAAAAAADGGLGGAGGPGGVVGTDVHGRVEDTPMHRALLAAAPMVTTTSSSIGIEVGAAPSGPVFASMSPLDIDRALCVKRREAYEHRMRRVRAHQRLSRKTLVSSHDDDDVVVGEHVDDVSAAASGVVNPGISIVRHDSFATATTVSDDAGTDVGQDDDRDREIERDMEERGRFRDEHEHDDGHGHEPPRKKVTIAVPEFGIDEWMHLL